MFERGGAVKDAMKALIAFLVMLVFALTNVGQVFSQDDPILEEMAADEELQQELKWLKAETYVFTPSRVMEDIKKSAASITVVTDRQIRQMGARDLADVLDRAVPNVSAFYTWAGSSNIEFRGGSGPYTVLLMINSQPLSNIHLEGTAAYGDLMIDNIKRIEVIRGPGSALYGANAFCGVINVITKEAEDIDGLELIARGGSYDTQQYNLLFGKTFSDLEVTFDLNFFKTHGFRGLIEEDLQTQIDEITGILRIPPASLAPGPMKGDRQKYDAALTLKYKWFKFDGRYIRNEWDMPVGWYAVLNEKSIGYKEDYYLSLSYEKRIVEGLDLHGKVYGIVSEPSADLQLFPPGAVFLTPRWPFIARWPNGITEVLSKKSRSIGVEMQATYTIGEVNTVVAGATYEDQKYYAYSISGNYLPTPNPFVLIKLPSVQAWPDEFVGETKKRDFTAAFIEDIWDLTDDLRLTAGARYDHYSDFGGHFSPRAGITWEYIKGYDLKLLYGHAFRAPRYEELYDPIYGNPDLGPMTTDTYEISLGADFTHDFGGRVTLYRRDTDDSIRLDVPETTRTVNRGTGRNQGVELEMKYDFGRGTYLAAIYTYFNHQEEGTETRTTQRHIGKFMTNIRLSRYFNFYADGQIYSGIERRVLDDTRDDHPGYGVVNATLIAKRFLKRYEELEFRGSVYNLFDEDYTMPSGPSLPNELPMPGINFLVEMRYKF